MPEIASPLDIFFNLLGESVDLPSPETAQAYVDQADAWILGYLRRTELPPENQRLNQTRGMAALVLYNRRGTEGESKRVEGDVVTWYEALPDVLKQQLAPYRTARAFSWLDPEG